LKLFFRLNYKFAAKLKRIRTAYFNFLKIMAKKIRTITVYKYEIPVGKQNSESPEDKFFKYTYTEMSETGEVVKEEKYRADGVAEERSVRVLNEKGQMIEEILYMADDEIAEHNTYEPDEKGRVMKIKKFYADETFDTIEFRYNEQGKVTETVTINSDGEVEAREVFEYEKDNLTRKKEYEYEELVSEESVQFDESGKSIEGVNWNREDGTRRNEFTWDEQGRLTKTLTYDDKDKLIGRMLYTYNEEGKITETDYETVRGRVITSIEYDEAGNAVEQSETNGKGETNHTVKRKYSDQHDVVEASVFIDRHGRDLNEEYILKYEYEYFES
jgi:hypothetical protein